MTVEKGAGFLLNRFSRVGSAHCTEARAGTFVVELKIPALKLRLDKLLLERGLAASRERAQALILAGKVLVDDQKMEKAGAQF